MVKSVNSFSEYFNDKKCLNMNLPYKLAEGSDFINNHFDKFDISTNRIQSCDNQYFNNNNINNIYNKSKSEKKKAIEIRNNRFEFLNVGGVNSSEKKPFNQITRKSNISQHKKTNSCIDSYLINQITNGFNINDCNSDLTENILKNIDEDFDFNNDLKEKSKAQIFKSLNPQTQFKSNTSMRLINLKIVQNSKNKITQYLNENIKKEVSRFPNRNQNFNKNSNNIIKRIDQKKNKFNKFNKGSIKFILSDTSSNENAINNKAKITSTNSNNLNFKNPTFSMENKTAFKVEESKANNNFNIINKHTLDTKVHLKDSTKNLKFIEIRNKINSVNYSNKNKSANIKSNRNNNDVNNNNFIYSYKIQEKVRKLSDNISESQNTNVLKFFNFNNSIKDEKNISQQRNTELKENPISHRTPLEGEYRNILSHNSKRIFQ